jgi:hypothetical protein
MAPANHERATIALRRALMILATATIGAFALAVAFAETRRVPDQP